MSGSLILGSASASCSSSACVAGSVRADTPPFFSAANNLAMSCRLPTFSAAIFSVVGTARVLVLTVLSTASIRLSASCFSLLARYGVPFNSNVVGAAIRFPPVGAIVFSCSSAVCFGNKRAAAFCKLSVMLFRICS